MKKTIYRSLFSVAVAVVLTLPATVSAQSKIGTIDLHKVFDNYYKTKQVNVLLQDEATEFDNQYKTMVDGWKKCDDEYKGLIEKANDQAISADERSKSKLAANKKIAELKDMDQAITDFKNRARTKLNDHETTRRKEILDEIKKVVETKAKAAGYSMIIDSAAESVNRTAILLYTNGENDITEAVLSQINAAAPVITDTKSSTNKTGTTTTDSKASESSSPAK